jgi:uncharacterized protein YdeI (YjbR/CyaY-like superfamily)
MAIDDHPRMRFETIAQFRAWLDEHHETAQGIRLEIAKKGAPITTHSVDESLDAALEYGWIDGRRKGIDDHVFEQYYTPRGPKSTWSVKNVETVTRKIAAGEMKPRGLAEVEIYFRLHQAKKPETVTRNVATFIAMLERGETLY